MIIFYYVFQRLLLSVRKTVNLLLPVGVYCIIVELFKVLKCKSTQS